jgi:hypothetical protein
VGMFNILAAHTLCPRCGSEISSHAEIRFGLLDGSAYRIGDRIKWSDDGKGLRDPKNRPDHGNYRREGYVECPICLKDFFLDIQLENDVFVSANQSNLKGYISD